MKTLSAYMVESQVDDQIKAINKSKTFGELMANFFELENTPEDDVDAFEAEIAEIDQSLDDNIGLGYYWFNKKMDTKNLIDKIESLWIQPVKGVEFDGKNLKFICMGEKYDIWAYFWA